MPLLPAACPAHPLPPPPTTHHPPPSGPRFSGETRRPAVSFSESVRQQGREREREGLGVVLLLTSEERGGGGEERASIYPVPVPRTPPGVCAASQQRLQHSGYIRRIPWAVIYIHRELWGIHIYIYTYRGRPPHI